MAKLLTGTRIYGTGTVDTQLFVSGTNVSISTNTGALQVIGGVGVGGNVFVGGAFTATGVIYQGQWAVSTGSVNSGTLMALAITATQIQTVFQTANATYYPTFVLDNNTTAIGEILHTTSSFSINPNTGVAIYGSTVNATSTATGALQVYGGVGIGGQVFIGGNSSISGITTVTNTTAATSTATGALQVRGGVGIGGQVFIGGNSSIAGITTVTNTTAATSTNTGALQVVGGLGVGGTVNASNLFGGNIYGYSTADLGVYANWPSFAIQGGNRGSGNYFTTPTNSILDLGTGNFTVEFWGLLTSVGSFNCPISWSDAGQTVMRIDSAWGGSILSVPFSTYPAPAANTWFHYAVSRQSGNTWVHINGTQYASGTGDVSSRSLSNSMIGRYNNGPNQEWQGYLSNIRVTKGTVAYAQGSTFVPQLTLTNNPNVVLLIGASSTIVDLSSNGFTFTYSGSQTINSATSVVVTATVGYSIGNYIAGTTRIANTTSAVSTTSGALQVIGGVGIGGNAFVGGAFTATGVIYQGQWAVNTGSVNSSTLMALAITATQIQTVFQTANATYYPTFVLDNNTTAIGEVVYTTSSFSINPNTGVAIYGSTVNATSTATGALQVRGGVGVARDVHVGGNLFTTGTAYIGGSLQIGTGTSSITGIASLSAVNITVTSSTQATSTSTGALVVAGGVGIGGNVFVGGALTATGVIYQGVWAVSTSSGGGGGGASFTGGTVPNSINITSSTPATSTSTGSLVVAGGVGIGGSLYTGGMLIGNSATFIIGVTPDVSQGKEIVIAAGDAPGAVTDAGSVTIRGGEGASSSQAGSVSLIGGSVSTGGAGEINITAGNNSVGSGGNINLQPGTGSVNAGQVVINRSTAATSTITGALRVYGGVGIGGSLYAGNIFSNGTLLTAGGGGGGAASTATFSTYETTVLSSTSTFTIPGGYSVGQIQVSANGIILGSGDFTASNGTTVVVNRSRNIGDVIRVTGMAGYWATATTYAFVATEVVAASNGQTTFTVSYNTASTQVYLNGVLLNTADYTASNGTTVVLASGTGVQIGHIMRVLSYNLYNISGALSLSGGTVNGTVNVTGSLRQNNISVNAISVAMSIALGM